MKNKTFRLIVVVIIALIILASCAAETSLNSVNSAEDIEGKTIGVLSGSASSVYMLTEYSDSVELRISSEVSTLTSELVSGEVDAVVCDDAHLDDILAMSSRLRRLEEPLAENYYCLAVSQENLQLLQFLNEAISALKRSGTLDELYDKWFGDGELMVGDAPLPEGHTLTVAVSAGSEPYCFYDEDGNLTGYDVDLATLIAFNLGVNVEFKVVEADKLVYMAESGKVNFSVGRITEGDDEVLYSDSYLTSIQYILVRKD